LRRRRAGTTWLTLRRLLSRRRRALLAQPIQSLNTPNNRKIILIIVDNLNIESGSIVGLESREPALSLKLESASLTLRESNVNLCVLTD
jgi:hypothetical protein